MTGIKHTIYISEAFDPTINLATEEYLMDICEEGEVIFYLWQNERTVVVGKHQNPYKECALHKIKEDNIRLVRRKSGGGAVFHDLGNLNFTFVAKKELYNVEKHFQVIIDALKAFDVAAQFTGRNDITVNDQKISGNAFINGKEVSCHHGTLLVDVEMTELGKYLTPPKIKMEAKGIKSVKTRVVNLKELNEEITVAALKKALVKSFEHHYEGGLIKKEMPNSQELAKYLDKYNAWNWNYGESPKADIMIENKFSWGNFVMDVSVKKGIISDCVISTDTLVDEPFSKLENVLLGKKYSLEIMVKIVKELFSSKDILRDLINEFKKVVV